MAARTSSFEAWGAQAGKVQGLSRGGATRCLNWSLDLPLLMIDLGVLGFSLLVLFPFCPSMYGERVFLVELGFQSAWLLHITL